MRCIIIDDEQLALDSMRKMVGELEPSLRLETFLNPLDGIRAAEAERIDAVFLDMEMPELTGLETAVRLLDIQPDMAVIFVTAYRDYAVEAYEMNVLDYVVKPVQRQRLAKTLERVRAFLAARPKAAHASTDADYAKHPRVCCFRRLELIPAGETVGLSGWRTTRAQELMAYFVYRRGEVVPKEHLLELFWADHDPDKASANLYVNISIIRKQLRTISGRATLVSVEEGYRLELGDILYDVEQWERWLAVGGEWRPDRIERGLHLFTMYRGDFLEEHPYEWAEPERHRLQLLLLQLARRLAELLVSMERYNEASELFRQIKRRFPLVEYGYFELMKLGAILKDHEMVTREYEMLCAQLLEELSERPSVDVVRWYDGWKRQLSESEAAWPVRRES